MSVSGGGLNLIGGSVKIDFKGITSDNIIMNISNININANTAVLDQNMLQHAITSDYDKIRLLVDSGKYSEIDRAGIISTLEEIKDELKLKQIPLSKLDKLKQYNDVYHMTLPWVMKVLDLIIKTGAFNM